MRIHTDAWEQFRLAANETEPKRPKEHRNVQVSPGAPLHKKVTTSTSIIIGVLAVLSILSLTFWSGLHERLITTAHDIMDFRTSSETLKSKVRTLEEERQRLADENRKLSAQNEQKSVEVARLVEELERLRPQNKLAALPNESSTQVDSPPEKPIAALKANSESMPAKQGRTKNNNEM